MEMCYCYLAFVLFAAYLQRGVGYEISSTTAVRNSVLAGGEFQLVCDVTGDYDGLVDIFYWKKYLPESGASGVKVTAVADVQEQFKRTSRYHARLDKSVAFRVVLTITDLRIEDSGEFKCEIYHDGSSLKVKTFVLNVLVPVTSMQILVSDNIGENVSNSTPKDAPIFYTNRGVNFRCVARGGYPEPEVRVLIGSRRIGSLYNMPSSSHYTVEGDTDGLRWLSYTVARANPDFRLKQSDDGLTLRCEGFVHNDVPTVTKLMKLRVSGPPSVIDGRCKERVEAKLGAESFAIECQFRSNPQHSKVVWRAETTRQILAADGGTTDGYSAYAKLDQGEWVAGLSLAKVSEVSFQKYTLTITNSVGSTAVEITLAEGRAIGEVTNGAAWCRHVSYHVISLVLLSLISALWHLC